MLYNLDQSKRPLLTVLRIATLQQPVAAYFPSI